MKSSKHTIKFDLFAMLLILGSFFMLTPMLSFALGVGGMQLDSTLSQKLDASIELMGVDADDVSNMSVNLAPDAIYLRMGIEPDPILKRLKFAVQKNEKNQFYIHVTTENSVTEPFLNFLIELNWSNGRLLREFTLLLDPPVLLDEEPTAIEAPKADLPPTFTVTKDSVGNETPSMVAAPKPTEILSEVEPDAIDEAFSKILANEAEAIQSEEGAEELAENDADSVFEDEIEQDSTAESGSLVYEKVQKNEILWNIAEKMRPENISVEQMMLALQRENTKAFYGDNISFLKAGAVLRIADTSTLSSISTEDAIAEISRQHQDWLAYRRERQAQNAVAAESASTPKNTAENESPVDPRLEEVEESKRVVDQPRLKLVSPIEEANGDAVSQTNAVLEAATEKLSQLSIELSIASEAVEAGKHENAELLNRLSALEEQMSAMQSLIQLKDAELQRLQTGEIIEQASIFTPLTIDTEKNSEAILPEPDATQHMERDNNSLWKDPMTIAVGIIATLLLILIGWIIRSRKTSEVSEDEVVYQEESQKSLDELFPEDADVEVEKESSIIKFMALDSDKEMPEVGLEPLTDINFENTEILDTNESLLDPIAEADVYLTYEKYDKAEALLHGAIESDPGRQELKLKLLEVFALSRNIKEFDKQAEGLYAAISGDESNSLWQHAILMSEDVDTKSPLFAGKKTEVDQQKQKTDLQAQETNLQEKETIANGKNIVEDNHLDEVETEAEAFLAINENSEKADDVITEEFSAVKSESLEGDKFEGDKVDELSLEEEVEDQVVVEPVTVIWSPEQVTEFDSLPKAILDTEIDDESKIEEAKITDAVVSDDELEQAMDSFTEAALEENWSEASGEEINDIVNGAIENATHNVIGPEEGDKKSLDSSLFLLSDEVGTKLDLAKAYIEMGDHEGALDLLAEVIEEGTSSQVNEAKELIESTEA